LKVEVADSEKHRGEQLMLHGKKLAFMAVAVIVLVSNAAQGAMRITEWAYQGANGEFIEFTNIGLSPINMTDWSMDDSGATAGAFSLSSFGTVVPGESVIVTDASSSAFRTAWELAPAVKVIGDLGVGDIGNNSK
jgi:hypothetical protein